MCTCRVFCVADTVDFMYNSEANVPAMYSTSSYAPTGLYLLPAAAAGTCSGEHFLLGLPLFNSAVFGFYMPVGQSTGIPGGIPR